MGGHVPLGYDVASRKLIPNEQETDLVRRIFNSTMQGTQRAGISHQA